MTATTTFVRVPACSSEPLTLERVRSEDASVLSATESVRARHGILFAGKLLAQPIEEMQTSVDGVRLELWAWFELRSNWPAPPNERVRRWCTQQMYLSNACGDVLVALVHSSLTTGVKYVMSTCVEHVRDLDPHIANAECVDAEWREAAREARARGGVRAVAKPSVSVKGFVVPPSVPTHVRAHVSAHVPAHVQAPVQACIQAPVQAPALRSATRQFREQVTALASLEGRATRSRTASLLR